MGQVEEIDCRTTGKQIIEPGWRVIFARETKDTANNEDKEGEEENENVLPTFAKGGSDPHVPDLNERWTQHPTP